MANYHSNPKKWIVFVGEGDKEIGQRLTLRRGLTNFLAESYDSSGEGVPELGYRPTEFVRVDQEHDPNFHGWSTHYKASDWVVDRVEEYPANMPGFQAFDEIVVCYCKYSPIRATLIPMPERVVSPDSFGGDEAAFKAWQEAQTKEPAKI
jgi:hypothetical protein